MTVISCHAIKTAVGATWRALIPSQEMSPPLKRLKYKVPRTRVDMKSEEEVPAIEFLPWQKKMLAERLSRPDRKRASLSERQIRFAFSANLSDEEREKLLEWIFKRGA